MQFHERMSSHLPHKGHIKKVIPAQFNLSLYKGERRPLCLQIRAFRYLIFSQAILELIPLGITWQPFKKSRTGMVSLAAHCASLRAVIHAPYGRSIESATVLF